MAVNYAYANPVGYFTETQTCGGIKKEYKVSMLRANCLWAELYFYKNEEGDEMQQFVGFYHDLNHLKENIKDAKSVVLVDYRGLTVEQDTVLRKTMRESDVIYKV